MIDHLLRPPRGFEEVVKLHFKMRRDAILAHIDKWLGMCRQRSGRCGAGGACRAPEVAVPAFTGPLLTRRAACRVPLLRRYSSWQSQLEAHKKQLAELIDKL
jgi:hypothetical protein